MSGQNFIGVLFFDQILKLLLLFVFYPEDVSHGPGECDVKYKKVGCFKDKIKARTLSVRVFNDRENIEWKAGKWEKFLKRQVLEE